MKFEISQKIIALSIVITFALLAFSCQPQGATTPTEAYKMLYAAVKSKDMERIKKMMSRDTMIFADGASKQQNKPIEKVLENGFYASTFSATLPKMRSERVKDNFGAVEVWNEKERLWEDVAFIKETEVSFQFSGADKAKILEAAKSIEGLEVKEVENSVQGGKKGVTPPEAEEIKNKLTEAGAKVSVDTGWKVAVGDIFRGTYQIPGKSQTIIEREAANASNPNNAMVPGANTSGDFNANAMTNVIVPQPPPVNKANGAKKK